ncbi:hypothetical protein ACTAB9_03975 [Pseudomonas syringae]|uniref:hypothetical protein n=1 Tax=Pseudomonas syringae TaxID=317 RepID=UPI003F754358
MSQIKFIIGLSILVLSSSCTPFQPPPPTYSQWYKEGVPLSGVKNAMRACGYTNLDGAGDGSPMNDVLKKFYCMKDSGFSRKDKLDLCKQSHISDSPVCDGRR